MAPMGANVEVPMVPAVPMVGGAVTWVYVPSPCAPVSEASISPSPESLARSVTWRGKHSPPRAWSRRCARAGWPRLLSGLTLPPSTATRGVASWISSLRACPASPSPSPDNAGTRPTNGTSGRTRGGSSTRQGLLWSSLRTCGSGPSASHGETFEAWATSALRRCFTPPRSSGVPSGDGVLFSSLPCPSARDWKSGAASDATMARNARPLNEVIHRLPAPMACDASRGNHAHHHGETNPTLKGAIMRLPAPTAADASQSGAAGYSTSSGRHSGTPLTDAICGAASAGRRGRLNPQLSEFIMGLPIDWTASTSWAIPSCPPSHGRHS